MEEMEVEESASMQKSLSSNQDPGWNDPPKWAIPAIPRSPQNYASGTRKTHPLNKRVAFPLNSATVSTSAINQSVNLGSLPPCQEVRDITTAPHKPVTAPTKIKNEDSLPENDIDGEKTLNEVLGRLEASVDRYIGSKNKADEVRKRLEVMRDAWLDGKLGEVVRQRIVEISEAFEDEDAFKADRIHVSLMINYATTCSSWISSIRHLIMEIKKKINSDQDEDKEKSLPYFIPTSTSG